MRRRRPRARGSVLLGLLLAVLLPASRARAQFDLPGELKTVAAVKLEGNRHVPSRVIWSILKNRRPSRWPWHQKQPLRFDFLRADTSAIRLLYRHYGYLDARASFRLTSTKRGGEVGVTYEIQEGLRSDIARVDLSGVHSYPEPQLRRRLWARPGRHYDPGYLELDTLRISALYQERGYRPHTAAAAERESLKVNVAYDVNEGPSYRVGEVYLSSPGQLHTRDYLIRRELLLHSGELYRRSRMQRSVERLYQTGLFTQVQITPLPDSTNSRIDFHLQVRERKPRWIDAGVGSGTSERFRFTGQWGHANIDSRGLQASVASRLALYGDGRFQLFRSEATLLERWLFRTRTSGQATPYYERRDDRSDPRFVVRQEARGLTFAAGRELGRLSRLSLVQDNQFVNQHYDILAPQVPDSTRDSLARSVVRSYRTNRLQLAVDRDSRDDPFNPSAGSQQSLLGEIAGGPLKGTSSFAKGQFLSAWYMAVHTDWVLAARLRAGSIQPFGDTAQFSPIGGVVDRQVARVPLESRFRLGGVNSLRGYNENSLPPAGGLAVVQANLELRVPVAGPFGVELFVDAGNVWARPVYMKGKHFVPKLSHEPLTDNDLRYVFGAGGRLNLPFGPLRLDAAWSPRPDPNLGTHPWLVHQVQFAIGPSF